MLHSENSTLKKEIIETNLSDYANKVLVLCFAIFIGLIITLSFLAGKSATLAEWLVPRLFENTTWLGLAWIFLIHMTPPTILYFTLVSKQKKRLRKSTDWLKEQLQQIIDESEDYWKKKNDLIQEIRMKALDDEEEVWEKARKLEDRSHKAQVLLIELES